MTTPAIALGAGPHQLNTARGASRVFTRARDRIGSTLLIRGL
ncbi:hypothetical protein [Lysinibacter sp. HNR]|nr:hypothetical protein [Lysinibacter sp. HNR]WGD36846.1 hypothetical protein FrondiHNR_10355 [Lysinibacter sp. HNR]